MISNYRFIMKNISISKFVLIILGLIILVKMVTNVFIKNEPKSIKISQIKQNPTITFMGKEYLDKWREPTNDELEKISISLAQNETRECANFYIIETSNNEYAVACTSDEKTYRYYGVWASTHSSGELTTDVFQVHKKPNE